MPERKSATPMYSEAVKDAIQAIYRVYGANLAAFFRDVQDSHGADDRGAIEGRVAATDTRSPKRRRVYSER